MVIGSELLDLAWISWRPACIDLITRWMIRNYTKRSSNWCDRSVYCGRSTLAHNRVKALAVKLPMSVSSLASSALLAHLGSSKPHEDDPQEKLWHCVSTNQQSNKSSTLCVNPWKASTWIWERWVIHWLCHLRLFRKVSEFRFYCGSKNLIEAMFTIATPLVDVNFHSLDTCEIS